jgi:aldose 1-epimerase
VAEPHDRALTLRYRSDANEEGYPGTVDASVAYTVIDNWVRIEYLATSDRDTVRNLTNYSYFNLAGRHDRRVLDHEILLHGDHFTPVTPQLIPTGELHAVAATPFDFRRSARIGARIEETEEQLCRGGGYDHNRVLRIHCAGRLTSMRLNPVAASRY